MGQFNQNGSIFTRYTQTGNIVDNIPVGTYEVKFSMEMGFYLEKRSDMRITSKVYGNAVSRSDKIFNTFKRRCGEGKNTGVLLSGDKGSGKSFIGRALSEMCLNSGYPVILISDEFHGTDFIAFMNAIEQPALVMFDEYEKVYSKKGTQESLLPMFDGTGSGNKLYLFTVNGVNINEFMLNRPSRVFYHFKYGKLDIEFLREYCKDMNVPIAAQEKIEKAWYISNIFSFDILQSMVEEILAYPETNPIGCILDMNFDPELKNQFWDVTVEVDGNDIVSFTSREVSFVNFIGNEAFVAHSNFGRKLEDSNGVRILKSGFNSAEMSVLVDYDGEPRVYIKDGASPAVVSDDMKYVEFTASGEGNIAGDDDEDEKLTPTIVKVKFALNETTKSQLIDFLK